MQLVDQLDLLAPLVQQGRLVPRERPVLVEGQVAQEQPVGRGARET